MNTPQQPNLKELLNLVNTLETKQHTPNPCPPHLAPLEEKCSSLRSENKCCEAHAPQEKCCSHLASLEGRCCLYKPAIKILNRIKRIVQKYETQETTLQTLQTEIETLKQHAGLHAKGTEIQQTHGNGQRWANPPLTSPLTSPLYTGHFPQSPPTYTTRNTPEEPQIDIPTPPNFDDLLPRPVNR